MKEEALRIVATANFIDPRFEPAIGSAILGLMKENIAIDEVLLSKLAKGASA
jgi:hypothetical protein